MSDLSIEWLRGLAEKGAKGIVNNIDARSLGRIADELEEWKQAAGVEAGLRREYVDKCAALVKLLEAVAAAKMPGEARRISREGINAVVSIPSGGE